MGRAVGGAVAVPRRVLMKVGSALVEMMWQRFSPCGSVVISWQIFDCDGCFAICREAVVGNGGDDARGQRNAVVGVVHVDGVLRRAVRMS